MLHHLGTSDQRYLAEPIMPCAADITTHHPSTLNDQLLHCVQKPAASASFQTTLPQSNRWLPPACRSLLKPPIWGSRRSSFVWRTVDCKRPAYTRPTLRLVSARAITARYLDCHGWLLQLQAKRMSTTRRALRPCTIAVHNMALSL